MRLQGRGLPPDDWKRQHPPNAQAVQDGMIGGTWPALNQHLGMGS